MAVTHLTKVLNIELNYSQVLDHLRELQNNIEKCDNAMLKVKQAFKSGAIGAKEYNQDIVRLTNAKKAYSKEQTAVTKQMQAEISKHKDAAGSINQLISKLEGLKSEYMALSDQDRKSSIGKNLLASIQSTSAQIKAETDKLKPAAFTAVADSIMGLKNRVKELTDEYNKYDKATRKGQKGQDTLREITNLNKELEKEQKLLDRSKKGVSRYNGSLVTMRARLQDLIKQFDNLSAKQRRSTEGYSLQKEISDITKELNKAEQATGRYQRSVGNYKTALSGAKTFVFSFVLGVNGLAQAFIGLRNVLIEGFQTVVEYNREVSKLAAILSTNTQGVGLLTAKAKELGSTTRFTAQEVVQLETELAKLGYKQSQIINMTESVLLFGQATGSDLAEAASLAGAALRMFELPSTEITNAVDKMTASTTNSALTFQYLATALPIVGGVAHTFGFKLEEVLTLLAMLANSGIDASMAATATRNIFLKLADANGELAKQLGKPVTNINELVDGLNELSARGINLNDILQLTTTRTANAFATFLRSTKQVSELNEALLNCSGTAAQMANTMDDNVGGALKRVTSANEDFMLSLMGEQGILNRFLNRWAKVPRHFANVLRSVDESINRMSNNYIENFSNPEGNYMQGKNEMDMEAYQKKVNKYLKLNYTQAEAEAQAFEDIKNHVLEYQKSLEKSYEKAVRARKKYAKGEGSDYSDMNNQQINKRITELKAYIERGENMGSFNTGFRKSMQSEKEELRILTEIVRLRNEEAKLKAQAFVQNSRLELFQSSVQQEQDKSGLGIETDEERNKRLQRERSAEKQRIASEQALETQLLKMAQESAEKRRQMLILQNKQEIQDIKYKIEEELKMRGDESEREKSQKQAAIANYNKLIVQKKKELDIELDRLSNEEIVKEAEYLKQLYSLKLSAVEEKSNEEFELRMKSLAEQEKAEIAQLELLAEKDATVEEQKEERKLAILGKYALERQKLLDKEKDQLVNKSLSNYQNQILKASNDEIEQARITADMKRYIYDNMYMKIGESEEEFALRQEQAMIELYEAENNIGKKREEAQQRLFQTRMNYANTEIQRLAIDKEAKKSYLDNLSQWLNEADDKFAERKSKAEKDYLDSTRALADAQMQIAASTSSALSGMFGTISQAIEDCGETNEENTRKAKIFGLAEVYITQGMAIAQAIHKAWSTSPNWIEAIAATATGVATVIASTVQAISSIKKAKLAKGAVNIQGQGSETSDSIPAQLSRGESVMTAKATKMFGGLLYAMNKFAAQPNYTLPNMYSTYNPVQTNATNKELSTSMRDAVENIHPVVAVTEINEVSTRLARVKALDNI